MNYTTYVSYVLMICASIPASLGAMEGLKLIYRGFDKACATTMRRGEIPVFMNDAKTISLAPTDHKPKVISTVGLISCTATLMFASDKDGYKHAILTHFSDDHSNHVPALKNQIQLIAPQKLNYVKFFIIMPKYSQWYHSEDCAAYDIRTQEMRIDFERAVQENAECSDITTFHIPYKLPPLHKFHKTDVYVTLNNNERPSGCHIINWHTTQRIDLE